MTDLSPAAQAIVKAFDDRYELIGPLEDDWQEQCIAAALRVIADQLIDNWYEMDITDQMREQRYDFYVIAKELEGQP